MAELSAQFFGELTKPLIGFTHAERGPWDKIWDCGKGNNERIPYASVSRSSHSCISSKGTGPIFQAL
jgi:hypothetical protein